MNEMVGMLLGFILTVAVFSYLLGDNPLFRIAVYLFIGATAGYTAALLIFNVLWPQMLLPVLTGSAVQRGIALIPLVLGVLVLMKSSRHLGRLGNPPMGMLAGIGAAVAAGGAISGTLFPQTAASIQTLSPQGNMGLINGGIVLLGTISTLAYFQFTMRRSDAPKPNILVDVLGDIGHVFIAITLGVLFAGVYLAALTALIERVDALFSIAQILGISL
ncbi:MAG TPA: hypothetical protein ENJ02_06815 [Chloroflexi bacterium]|nr:hypothetical protein [Chloroflexota bacterium]